MDDGIPVDVCVCVCACERERERGVVCNDYKINIVCVHATIQDSIS